MQLLFWSYTPSYSKTSVDKSGSPEISCVFLLYSEDLPRFTNIGRLETNIHRFPKKFFLHAGYYNANHFCFEIFILRSTCLVKKVHQSWQTRNFGLFFSHVPYRYISAFFGTARHGLRPKYITSFMYWDIKNTNFSCVSLRMCL